MDEMEAGVCTGDIQTSKITWLGYENNVKEKISCDDGECNDHGIARGLRHTESVNPFGFIENSISGHPSFRNPLSMDKSRNSIDDGSSLSLKQLAEVGVSVEEIMEAVNYGSGRRARKRKRVGGTKAGSKRRVNLDVTRSIGEATLLYTKGCHKDASSILKKVVVLAPGVPAPYHMLGLVYAAMGEKTKALNCYMLAAHLKPKDPCLWKLLVTLSAEQGNTGQARYCLRKAISADPEDTSLISLHASLYVELKDYRKAAGLYEKVLEEFPDDVQVMAAMGDLYVKSDQPEKAITILEDFLMPRPYTHSLIPALDLLVSICVNRCQFEKALCHLDRARTELPMGDELPLHLRIKEGICYIRLGESEKAEHLLAAVLFLENALEYPHLVMQVGDSNCALGRHELALKYYLMLEMEDAEDMWDICSSLYAQIAECYSCLNDIEKATLYMYKVLRVSGEDVGSRLRLASVLVDQGKDEEAVQLLSPPRNSQCDNGCGKQWWRNGEIRLMLARIYKTKGDDLNFVGVISPPIRESLAIERRQRRMRGRETSRLRIRKNVLRERAKLLDEGDSIFQGFKPVACSSDLSKALRARAILKRKEKKRISDSSESEEPVCETMMEPPIPKVFNDGGDRGDLIVEVCETLESMEKNDEALEIISLALRLYLDERLVSIGSRIVSHTNPEVGFEFSKCVVEKEPRNVAAWNSYHGMVSKIDFRFHRHCKFLHRMKVLHKDCVPPVMISGHQLTMISQHQAAAREYLEAYRLLPNSSLVNLCVGCHCFFQEMAIAWYGASSFFRSSSKSKAAIHQLLPSSSRRCFSTSDDSTAMEIETSLPFTCHKCEPPSRTVATTSKELMKMFRDMAQMRRMEIAADSLYKSKLIRGFCHLYDGQEAVSIGMEAAITKKDCIITAYRDHCTFVGRGGTLIETLSELMGRRSGCSRGKGGSMHLYKKDAGFYGGHGIVGAQIPLGCGIALGQKYSKDMNVTFTLYGDGAANQGQLFEALNISALLDLPVVLVCENNHYGMGTAEWRAAKSPDYYKRGDYVPGLKVDGMDVLAVKQACKFAKDHSLRNGPIIVEMDTYRYHGHSMSDPGSTYRTRDEISGIRQERDPVERIRKLILGHDLATEKEMKEIEKEMRKEVDEAIAKAKESWVPDPSELFTNVYAQGYGVKAIGVDRKEGTILS